MESPLQRRSDAGSGIAAVRHLRIRVGGGRRPQRRGSDHEVRGSRGAADRKTRRRRSAIKCRFTLNPLRYLPFVRRKRGGSSGEGIPLGEDFPASYGDPGPGRPKGRRAGVVMHPTSLPGGHGCGDLGQSAFEFVDWLERAGMQAWQVLPLVPPERMFWSPYAGQNANTGNVLLISLEGLVEDGLLRASEVPPTTAPASASGGAGVGACDFDLAAATKEPLLALAAGRLLAGEAASLMPEYEAFVKQNADWLDPAAIFDCLSAWDALAGRSWWDWPAPLRDMESGALASAAADFGSAVSEFKALQFLFDRQWRALRAYANGKGISIIGDMPIYVGGHSADVWSNRALFELNAEGKPNFVAGCPPDAFSATGQLWGNPLYDWKAQKKDGYRWWVRRLVSHIRMQARTHVRTHTRTLLLTPLSLFLIQLLFHLLHTQQRAFELYDETRIDHFRGFAGYWSVGADQDTAIIGSWRAGPGLDLFDTLKDRLGETRIMAEDLGVITPDVVALREAIDAPGMLVLQFGFDGNPTNPHLPHNHYENCFVYPGTHDNDTTNGWYEKQEKGVRDFCRLYLNLAAEDEKDMAWTFLTAAMASVAGTAMVTLQDVLSLGNEGRMNLPGKAEGNWRWQMAHGFDTDDMEATAAKLKALAGTYDRVRRGD